MWRLNPFKSLGAKLFLVFIISNVIFVSCIGFFSYSVSKGIVKEKVASASNETINQAGEKLDLLFSQYDKFSTELVLDKEVQANLELAQNPETDEFDRLQVMNNLTDLLLRKANTDENISNIAIMDIQLEKIASSSAYDMKKANMTSVVTAAENGKGSSMWLPTSIKPFTESNMEPVFAVVRQIKSIQSGDTLAICLIEIKAAVVANEINRIKLGDTGTMEVLTNLNAVIASKEQQEWGGVSTLHLPADMMKLESISQSIDIAGIGNVLVQSYKSKINGWITIGITPVGELVNSAKRILNITLIILLFVILSAIIVGYFLVRMITRPLTAISELMKEGEKGNLIVRASFKRKDEMGRLGLSFDQMMEQIQRLVKQTNESAVEVLTTATEILLAAKHTANAAREIATAIEDIAEGAISLSLEAEKGDNQTQVISSNMESVIFSNQEMSGFAMEVYQASEQGVGFMAELILITGSTESMTRLMAEKVEHLKESTASIRRILDLLQEMTKKTNILSLNAAIEAARAGSAGKGFMVVADEIRLLADSSKQSIAVVGRITEQIQSEVDQTVLALTAAYPIFKEQASSVIEAERIFVQVQTHMGGFLRKLSQVSESIQVLEHSQYVLKNAITNVSIVSHQSSATTEQVASLSDGQLSVSGNLERLSEKLGSLSNSLTSSLRNFKF